jgi:GTP-binding protein
LKNRKLPERDPARRGSLGGKDQTVVMNQVRNDIRNVAIIAHVDHGKTTLVDALLRQSGNFRDNQVQDTMLDSNPLERERGITILAKNVAINYTDPATGQVAKINLIDTPGHADFGGEVERVLSMADGVFLLVDAAEGPDAPDPVRAEEGVPERAAADRRDQQDRPPDARIDGVVNEVFDLFVELGADDETLDFPIIYASGRAGIASWKAEERGTDIKPVFEAILKHIPAPHGDPDKSLQVRITSIQYNDYVGRIGVGRIYNGVIKSGQQVSVAKRDGSIVKSKMQQLQVFDGFGRKNADDAAAGDIVALIGLESVDIGDTICDFLDPHPLDPTDVEPPTLVMMFSVNDSPFAGREGKYVTSRNLRERLFKELESNVALKVEETEAKDAFKVSGRGLLHLGHPDREHAPRGVRAEHLQAAGDHAEEQGDRRVEEPIEYLVVDVPEKSMGGVMELVGNRKGELVRMDNREGQVHLEFTIPARGLIGLRTRMLTATQGTAIMHHNFHEYAPARGDVPGRANGVMISMANGSVNAFALNNLQQRGVMFVEPTQEVYEGMIVAENARDNDMPVNPTTAKKLTNMRTTSSDENIILKPARKMTLEQALEYIEEDELVEATPQNIRLRKQLLTENARKKAGRSRPTETVEV